VCCWLWTLCHTTQHGAVLIIFPLNLQTITITRMLSSGGEGQLQHYNNSQAMQAPVAAASAAHWSDHPSRTHSSPDDWSASLSPNVQTSAATFPPAIPSPTATIHTFTYLTSNHTHSTNTMTITITSVTTATSLASFKRQLKTFLFAKSFPEL